MTQPDKDGWIRIRTAEDLPPNISESQITVFVTVEDPLGMRKLRQVYAFGIYLDEDGMPNWAWGDGEYNYWDTEGVIAWHRWGNGEYPTPYKGD
jgi:hypothetical protein